MHADFVAVDRANFEGAQLETGVEAGSEPGIIAIEEQADTVGARAERPS